MTTWPIGVLTEVKAGPSNRGGLGRLADVQIRPEMPHLLGAQDLDQYAC
jgi:hypothetical protein